MKSAWAILMMLVAQGFLLPVAAAEKAANGQLAVLSCKCVYESKDRCSDREVNVDLNDMQARAVNFETLPNEYRWVFETDPEEAERTGLYSKLSGELNRTSLVFEFTAKYSKDGETTIFAITRYQCEIAKPRV